jgi:hypothetical protein
MKTKEYLVLMHLGNFKKTLQMKVCSTEDLSKEEIKEVALSKLIVESKELIKLSPYNFDDNKE